MNIYPRTLRTFLLICISAFLAPVFGQQGPAYSLLVQGQVNAPVGNRECIVELLESNGGTDTVAVSKRHSFKVELRKNSFYTLRISKPGYITRLIAINTEIKSETDFVYKFSFQINLIPEDEKPKLNSDVLDFPVAIIHYHEEFDDFFYNEQYTSEITGSTYRKN